MEFKQLNLSEHILKALESQNFIAPTKIQELCIPEIMAKHDVVGTSVTGSGKTFAFAIPALELIDVENRAVQALVVCPTRELALQVCDEIRKLTLFKESIKVVPVYGGSDISRQIKALKNAKIVVGTPGRIMDHMNRRTLKLENVKMVVLDEADEMLNMGFKEDMEKILSKCNPHRQTIMFSATMPAPILAITKNFMNNPVVISSIDANTAQSFIEQYYICVEKKEKEKGLISLLKKLKPNIAIIFCNTKVYVDKVAVILKENGIDAVGLHGDMRQSERKRTIDKIKKDDKGILIATDVMARGIDINNVNCVINFDLPNNDEYYIHRIGRTARAGKKGQAYTFINTKSQLASIKTLQVKTKNKIENYTDLEGITASFSSTLNNSKSSNNQTKLNENSTRRFNNNKSSYKNRDNAKGSKHTTSRFGEKSTNYKKSGAIKTEGSSYKNKENKLFNEFTPKSKSNDSNFSQRKANSENYGYTKKENNRNFQNKSKKPFGKSEDSNSYSTAKTSHGAFAKKSFKNESTSYKGNSNSAYKGNGSARKGNFNNKNKKVI